MKTKINGLNKKVIACFCIFAEFAYGQESVRMLVLQVPTADVSFLRTELASPEKLVNVNAIDPLLTRKGVKVLADFKKENPWISHFELKELGETILAVKPSTEVVAGGVKIACSPHQLKFHLSAYFKIDVGFSTGGQNCRYLKSIRSCSIASLSRWHERNCWADAKEAIQLWEFPVSGSAIPRSIPGTEGLRMEMRWFQATPSDIAKLKESQSATRDKALQWLTARAKFWRETLYVSGPGSESEWEDTSGKNNLDDIEQPYAEEGLAVATEKIELGKPVNVSWKVTATVKGKSTVTPLTGKFEWDVWEFLPVEGIPQANVVACRIGKL